MTRTKARSLIAKRGTLALLLCGSFLCSCAAPPVDTKAMVIEWVNYMQSDYVLRPGDQITINLHPEAEGTVQTILIPPTGSINLARVPEPLVAIGKPMRTFRAEVRAAYAKIFRDEIVVQVSLLQASASSVYVTGEVKSPGPRPYTQSMTLSQAIAAAGGFIVSGKLTDIRILRHSELAEPKTYRVNLDAILHDGAPDFLVLPGDVVYCQKLWVVDVTDTLNLYLWSLLPVNSGTTRYFTGGV